MDFPWKFSPTPIVLWLQENKTVSPYSTLVGKRKSNNIWIYDITDSITKLRKIYLFKKKDTK